MLNISDYKEGDFVEANEGVTNYIFFTPGTRYEIQKVYPNEPSITVIDNEGDDHSLSGDYLRTNFNLIKSN